MPRPKIYPDVKAYRREYNIRPEVKERNKYHNLKWRSKPEVRKRLKVYNREYMREYWEKNPEKYRIQKLEVARDTRERRERIKRGEQ
jgi:hypothetical protein